MLHELCYRHGRINHSGGPIPTYGGGPLLIGVARIFSGRALFFPQKRWRPFLVVVTFKHTRNVQTPNSVVKIWQLIGGPLAAGPPPMVQPAQWLIRPWLSFRDELLFKITSVRDSWGTTLSYIVLLCQFLLSKYPSLPWSTLELWWLSVKCTVAVISTHSYELSYKWISAFCVRLLCVLTKNSLL